MIGKKRMQVKPFIFKISDIIYRIFYQVQIERMQANSSTSFPLFSQASSFAQDIFSKYLSGCGVSHLPFQLFKAPSARKRSCKRGGVRGPYRRYSSEEKLQIIQRMLNGEPLKKIAQKTMIPKRNLIRWKHEFLHHSPHLTSCGEPEESVELDFGQGEVKKDSMETRVTLATESMDLIRLQ